MFRHWWTTDRLTLNRLGEIWLRNCGIMQSGLVLKGDPGNMGVLYVLGARQRKLLLKNEDEPHLYESALVARVDTETGHLELCLEYQSPPEARASEDSSNIFKCGTLIGDKLYACTSTEVLIFKVPSFERIGYVSLPCFNDLHHVTPTRDGNLLVANTGLDMVVKFNLQGNTLEEWSVLDEIPWTRFSPKVDYRKVDSTKPHKSHPNFVFELGNDVWVTRFIQRDAVCLTTPGKRIEIGVQRPHDGLLFKDRLYFTTVDGKIVIANCQTLQLERIIELSAIEGEKRSLLGWCRGLLPLDERRIWVGFTRVRKTKFKENVLWVKQVFRDGMLEAPTHIALYDIVDRRCLQEIELERHDFNVVFSMFEAVAQTSKDRNGVTANMGAVI